MFYDSNVKRLYWYIFASMRGGVTRIKIINLLLEKPLNHNQISKELGMDYKTVQHHLKILKNNRIIDSEDKKYGTIYFPSGLFQRNMDIFKEIKDKIKE